MNAPLPLPALDSIRAHEDEMIAIRRQIHARPELAYEEHATSALVAERLERWGFEVHRGLGGTGVVGTLKAGTSTRRLGLRADMDALPIQETSGKPWASQVLGKMHACGHDGHTAMLLAAARHLAATRHFDGILHLVFQPAEEGLGGARKMIEDGFFELFPCDAMFGLHNMPGHPVGQLGFRAGPMMASSDSVIVTVRGKGGHGAKPHRTVDPVVAASSIVMALQTVVSRNVPPLEMGIVTVGAFLAGNAPNVIPETATLRITVRAYRPEVRDLLEERITAVISTQAAVYGATAEIDYQRRYPMVINHAEQTAFARQVALDWVGEAGLIQDLQPLTGSEDFAFFLERVPGCYFLLGNGEGDAGGCDVHNPAYDFNDRALGTGASYWVRLAERYLSKV
ncbi:amidohydrolase [Aquincola sp. S2]|uniref:Amidohydrolase n=1 Tax=Pseudaquabacterium terrae TaxID=2732868 RepID=A0ABX2EP63_9BURK|nr:M20 aminoacylase family protein [Aquabacterium terrae]NRF70418.1 amidohydrolase [Aquabacterium terrae]